jgi:hypothetical protein
MPFLALLAAIVGLAVGAGATAAIWAGDDGDGIRTEPFYAFAQGFSGNRLDPASGRREITIQMRTFNSVQGLESLRIRKFLDERTQQIQDGVYTFRTGDGDVLELAVAGEAAAPQGPDEFFTQTHEQWRVTRGTGRFEDVEGEGELVSADVIGVREDPPGGGNGVKYFTGELHFPD